MPKELKADKQKDMYKSNFENQKYEQHLGLEPNQKLNSAIQEAIANMKLIAAAPDLLEALQKIAAWEMPVTGQFWGPHEVSQVKCSVCNHSWAAVRPKGVQKLECPNCGGMVYFENV